MGFNMQRLSPTTLRRARHLRRQQTDAELLLWHRLRDRRLDGYKFCRQKPTGPYFLDFYCAEAKLAVELDGGGHAEAPQIAHDKCREEFLVQAGIRTVRYWNNAVLCDTASVLEDIWKHLQHCTPS